MNFDTVIKLNWIWTELNNDIVLYWAAFQMKLKLFHYWYSLKQYNTVTVLYKALNN